MKICHKCRQEIKRESIIGRQELCPSCGADLRCCVNCAFYEPGAYNDCREPQAERVLDKTRSNFCDYFTFIDSGEKKGNKSAGAKDKLEGLFKK